METDRVFKVLKIENYSQFQNNVYPCPLSKNITFLLLSYLCYFLTLPLEISTTAFYTFSSFKKNKNKKN